jgi:hypothetical protein
MISTVMKAKGDHCVEGVERHAEAFRDVPGLATVGTQELGAARLILPLFCHNSSP